ncbi:MAG: PleD family two-component system response regulator [Alphaproteobacteria bacterium]|nr:PleD family two-component system response regulator [Alphaproteobacteria bacterium]
MSARVLIVDDTPVNIRLLEAKLARDYYVISTAENGVEALKKIDEEKPDIVLLDVMMPEMDGFETCRRIKANPETAHIPVIMITALSDVADRVRGLAAGADDFLGKPINDLALMARVRSLLRMKILMDEWRARESTALKLSPDSAEEISDPLNVRNCRILIIDDDKSDSVFIREALAPLSAHIEEIGSIAQAEALVSDGFFDLVFSKLDLAKEDGLTICPCLRSNPSTRHIPILLLANPDDIERVAKGLDLGANDYLIRPLDTHELFARARTQLRHKRNYDRLRSGLEHNLMLALIDPLTGAFNRRYLDAHLPRFLKHAQDEKKSLSVQMIDIDFFKRVNDQHGHPAGDAILKEIAHRISNNIRPTDFFVRMGGEEFAIVMPETELQNAAKIAERIRQRIAEESVPVDNTLSVPITISIGVAEMNPKRQDEPNKLFSRADGALLRAKQKGRNIVVVDGIE